MLNVFFPSIFPHHLLACAHPPNPAPANTQSQKRSADHQTSNINPKPKPNQSLSSRLSRLSSTAQASALKPYDVSSVLYLYISGNIRFTVLWLYSNLRICNGEVSSATTAGVIATNHSFVTVCGMRKYACMEYGVFAMMCEIGEEGKVR